MRRVILAIVSTAAGLVLLLSFKTHSPSSLASASSSAIAGATPGGSGNAAAGSTASGPAASGGASSSASPSSSSTSSGAVAAKTVTGDAAQTIYGPVQVRVTVKDGKLTAVSAIEYPQETPRDEQINAYAIPALNQEALAADSAKIDTISGATYTSGGYISSLQSALDKAGL